MNDKQTFKVLLKKHEDSEAAGITIPFDVKKAFGAKRICKFDERCEKRRNTN